MVILIGKQVSNWGRDGILAFVRQE